MERLYRFADTISSLIAKRLLGLNPVDFPTLHVSIPQDASAPNEDEAVAFVVEFHGGEKYHVKITKLGE